MTACATFEQAFSASAFTGREIFAFADETVKQPAPKHSEKSWSFLGNKTLTRSLNALPDRLTEHSSTLLRHSGMFDLVGDFLNGSVTFAFPEPETSTDPREFIARIGNYMDIENPDELAQFLANNADIAELLEQTTRLTANHPQFAHGEISVFSEVSEKDYCVYVNADFTVDRYEAAYAIEDQVFSEALEPHFDKVNFRILLSFDTDSDD